MTERTALTLGALTMAVVGTFFLGVSLMLRLQADADLETARALKFRPKVVVYRTDIPIVISLPQVCGSGIRLHISDKRVTPVFAREDQFVGGR